MPSRLTCSHGSSHGSSSAVKTHMADVQRFKPLASHKEAFAASNKWPLVSWLHVWSQHVGSAAVYALHAAAR
jgi:hypothetical protein